MLIEKYTSTMPFTLADIHQFIASVDDDFEPKLSERVDLGEYAKKVFDKAEMLICHEDGAILGMSAYYCNNEEDYAYLTFMCVSHEARGRGIGSQLLRDTIESVRNTGLRYFKTQTWSTNEQALRLYTSKGFKITGQAADRARGIISVFIEIDFQSEVVS